MRRSLVIALALGMGIGVGFAVFKVNSVHGVISPITAYEADVNKDGAVTSGDLGAVAHYFGSRPPTPTRVPSPAATPASNCDLSGRTFTNVSASVSIGGAPLVDFSHCRMESTRFTGTTALVGLSFASADMRDVVLDAADLDDSDFTGANLHGATLTNINRAQRARFVHADLSNAVLSNFNFDRTSTVAFDAFAGADFSDAITTGTDVSGVWWLDVTCPDHTNSDSDGNTCVGHGFASQNTVSVALDCDPTTAVVDLTCSVPSGTPSQDVSVVITNHTGADVIFNSFLFKVTTRRQLVFNPKAGADANLNANPDFNDQLAADPSDGPWICDAGGAASPMPDNDPSPSVATSSLVCFDGAAPGPNGAVGKQHIPSGATLTLATIHYDVLGVGEGAFILSEVEVIRDDYSELASCLPTQSATPADCFGTSVTVGAVASTATVTNGPTATPTP